MRYSNRTLVKNSAKKYKNLKDREVIHFTTAVMRYPKPSETIFTHIETINWRVGDRLYKLANEYYGDSTKWWVIAWFNQKPTESHFSLGDIVYIPLPLSTALDMLGY